MYKVVEGLVPAMPTQEFISFQKQRRTIKPKQYSDHETTNIVNKRVCRNTKALVIPTSKSPQYEHSFLVETTIHWNHLPESVVHADSVVVESFKTALRNHRQ